MWQIMWLRRLIRRNTKRIPEEKAASWKQRLTFAYVFFAWNAFGLVMYMCYTGRADWAEAGGYKEKDNRLPAQKWASFFEIKDAHVIRINGLKLEGTYDIKENDENNELEHSAQN